MDVIPAEVRLDGVCSTIEASFRPLAEQKGLDLVLEVQDGAPESIVTDQQRLHQVLKNLLSNAVKFTESGQVSLRISAAPSDMRFGSSTLARARRVVAFEVSDSGIGIAPEQLRIVFEAFQQADGTISRRYGGTGLGLTISREITRLLGGEIRVTSSEGEGSVFTLFLPDEYHPLPEAETPLAEEGPVAVTPAVSLPPMDPDPDEPMADDVPDDRGAIQHGDDVILVVEAEHALGRAAVTIGHEHDVRVLVASRGGTALALAREFQPMGILLDTQLPYTDGMTLLAHLKQDTELRHIPVHVFTASEPRHTVLRAGAMGVHEGPVTDEAISAGIEALRAYAERTTRRLLIVEDDDTERGAVIALLGGDDIDVVGVSSSEEAIAALEAEPFDCVVLDLKLPKMSGFALLEHIKGDVAMQTTPVIVYTGKDLTRREETRLSKFAETIIIKDARSPERLLEETTLHLHRSPDRLPDDQRIMLEDMHASAAVLAGKKVLVVDDDVRNVFALTSVLERHGMVVSFAENGRDGIAALQADPDIDIVLMDIMMPEMDGYETMAAVRELPQFRKLPIIALTAKAMKGDRERSIAAGASDYVTKPVDVDQLLSLMRVWLYQ
jgi:CheY-like chemotaxis protein